MTSVFARKMQRQVACHLLLVQVVHIKHKIIGILPFIWAITVLFAPLQALSSLENKELSAIEHVPVVISQGEQRLIHINGLVRYSLGGDVVRILRLPTHTQKDDLLIKGVKPGMGDLWVWKINGASEHRIVRVEKWAPLKIPAAVFTSLETIQELEVIPSGDGFVLRGEIQTLNESARLAALIRGFPKLIQNQTTVSRELLDEAERKISSWIEKNNLQNRVQIEKLNTDLLLHGNIPNPTERKMLEEQLRSIYPMITVDLQSFPDQSQPVFFRIFLLEIKKDQFNTLGLLWPEMTAGAFKVTPRAIRSSIELDLTLQAMSGSGSARILANPELVVRVPGESELFAGGELPIEDKTRYSSKTSWKQYGLKLKLKVTNRSKDRIRLDISTELSHLDKSISNTEVPGVRVNQMKTQVDARFGQALFLCGLLQESTRSQAKGIPMLREIPILGALFGSEDYLNEQSELVAILLPNSLSPPAPMEKIDSIFPSGTIPPPRNWISPEEQHNLQMSEDYPWNALK